VLVKDSEADLRFPLSARSLQSLVSSVRAKDNQTGIAIGLGLAVFLWGANNAGVKYLMRSWPPIATGGSRFLVAGLLMLALLRWTKVFGARTRPFPADLERALWWRGGLAIAVYIAAFNWALKLVPLSHVALYLGTAPVWALLWEEPPRASWRSAQRYAAAALARLDGFDAPENFFYCASGWYGAGTLIA
jgi:hypothetical protein